MGLAPQPATLALCRRCPSAPNPKFASFCGTLVCKLGIARTLDTNLVGLWLKRPHFGLAARLMRTFEPPHWLEMMLAALLASPFVDRGGVHDEPVRRSYSGVLDKIEGIAWVTGASAP